MVKKNEFIWNMLGSFIYAMFSAIILAICTRANSIEIAGIFSIAYATSCILNAIGDFGIRIYQVTDTNRKYTFSEYLSARIIAILIMVVFSIIFVVISGYSSTKLAICLILVLYRVIDNLSETYQAEFQMNNRLDIAGKSMVLRNSIAIIIFAIFDIITHNIVVASILMTIANLIIFILYDMKKIKKFNSDKIKIKIKEAKDAIEKTKKKQGKFFKEFKEFALRGNVLDLAVGVLIGSAFQSVVTSFTNNIISPILGCFGGVNFSEWVLEIGKLRLTYGAFLTDIINFLIMAFVIFILVKVMNKIAKIGEKQEEKKAEDTKICPHCYNKINIKADRCPYCTSKLNESIENIKNNLNK